MDQGERARVAAVLAVGVVTAAVVWGRVVRLHERHRRGRADLGAVLRTARALVRQLAGLTMALSGAVLLAVFGAGVLVAVVWGLWR